MCAGTYAILSPRTTQSHARGVTGSCMQAPMQVSLLGPHSHVSMELRGVGGTYVQAPMLFSLLGIELIVFVQSVGIC